MANTKGTMMVNIRGVARYCCKGCYHREFGEHTNTKGKTIFRRQNRRREAKIWRNQEIPQ